MRDGPAAAGAHPASQRAGRRCFDAAAKRGGVAHFSKTSAQAVKFLVHLFGAATTRGSGETLAPNFTDPQVLQAARKVVDLLKNDTPHTRLKTTQRVAG